MEEEEKEKIKSWMYQIEIVADSLDEGDQWNDPYKRSVASRWLRLVITEMMKLIQQN